MKKLLVAALGPEAQAYRDCSVPQKGDPPKFLAAKYFDHSRTDSHEYIKGTPVGRPFCKRNPIADRLPGVDNVTKFSFYPGHRESTNIKTLFRRAAAAEKFGD